MASQHPPPHPIRNVTVYCSSSEGVHEQYRDLARELGRRLAASGRRLVYGGGKVGLMGDLAQACREAGGSVTGIITQRLREAEQMDEANTENIVVSTMRERKALLESRGDAMVVLPGGLGTLEEFFEILVGLLLGEHDKPIVLVNAPEPESDGYYYDPLLNMFRHMVANRFARPQMLDLFDVCRNAHGAIELLDELGTRAPIGDTARRAAMPTRSDPEIEKA